MKFIMAFSCGKDSCFALDKMLAEGHELTALFVSCSQKSNRSVFHGADEELLNAYKEEYGVPLIQSFSNENNFTEVFEEGLKKGRELGAEAVCFGDIALPNSKGWNEARALAAGLKPIFPLWQTDRTAYVNQLLDLGYHLLIKVVDTAVLPEEILGQYLDKNILDLLAAKGADICGENGEYHSLVAYGPNFKKPFTFECGKIGHAGQCAYIETMLKK